MAIRAQQLEKNTLHVVIAEHIHEHHAEQNEDFHVKLLYTLEWRLCVIFRKFPHKTCGSLSNSTTNL